MATVADEQTRNINAVYFLGLLTLMEPEWDGASDWLGESMTQLADEEGTVSTIRGDRRIELTFHSNLGMLLLSVEPQS